MTVAMSKTIPQVGDIVVGIKSGAYAKCTAVIDDTHINIDIGGKRVKIHIDNIGDCYTPTPIAFADLKPGMVVAVDNCRHTLLIDRIVDGIAQGHEITVNPDKYTPIIGFEESDCHTLDHFNWGTPTAIAPPIPTDENDDDTTLNAKVVAKSLIQLSYLTDLTLALEGLNDLYSIWDADLMRRASTYIKTVDIDAYTKLLKLVDAKKHNDNPLTRYHRPTEGCNSIDSQPTKKASGTNPREAVTIDGDRVEVDIDKLDLNYQPSSYPAWHPNTTLKPYQELTKLYLDIETTGLDPTRDRVIAIGLLDANGGKHTITDKNELTLLKTAIEFLTQNKPELLIGHNLVNFDLPFIMHRCKLKGMSTPFRFGDKPMTISASSVNGKPIEFKPVRWEGVDILDTYQQIAIWDKQAAKLDRYDLKSSVIALKLRDDRRLELDHYQIKQCWESGDLATITDYLNYDLEDTKLLADFLIPVVYGQMVYVPEITLQDLAVASPARKAQNIHQALIKGRRPEPDEPKQYEGGKVECITPGLHYNVAKIDVSSLYPSIMLRYGICSRKDRDRRFLGVLNFMRSERLRLKTIAKSNPEAGFMEKALKVLINGSYGFFGTGGYPYNDYEAAALVTAYGRKILDLMTDKLIENDCTIIETDTDGILFSSTDPDRAYEEVSKILPDGIGIELEQKDCGAYVPKAKNYVIVSPDGKVSTKGIFRKRNRYNLEKDFPIEFIRLYFTRSPSIATVYYQEIRQRLCDRLIDTDDLTVTRRIAANEKKLIDLGFGQAGDKISYWIGEEARMGKSGKRLKSAELPTNTEPYWIDYYLDRLDEQYNSIIGENG